MSAQVAADLRAAAEVLRRDGWTQGGYVSIDGCRCAVGALMALVDATTDDLSVINGDAYKRIERACETLVNAVEPPSRPPAFWDAAVTSWNDAPGRTADEVIAALEAAADAAEASDA